jgi:hypothetical protein
VATVVNSFRLVFFHFVATIPETPCFPAFSREKKFLQMAQSLSEGPSPIRRVRIPDAEYARYLSNLREGETFSEVVRQLLDKWADRRERAKK